MSAPKGNATNPNPEPNADPGKDKKKEKKPKPPQRKGPEMDYRDPNDINDHLAVEFEDVIAEPDGARSLDCVWRCSYRCFTGSKNCCYRTLTIFCGCLLALCWGCQFACVTFVHVWQITPALRLFAVNCGCMQKFWGTALQCCLAPICETMGLCLSRIQVSNYAALDQDHRKFVHY